MKSQNEKKKNSIYTDTNKGAKEMPNSNIFIFTIQSWTKVNNLEWYNDLE